MREPLNRLRSRWPWFDVTVAAQERYRELDGRVIAAAVTLSLFISLFPALLVGAAVLGFVASGRVDLAGDIVDRLGLNGTSADAVREAIASAERTRRTASVVGLAGLAWSTLGVARAFQLAVDHPWQVKRDGLRHELSALVWLLLTAAVVALTTGGTALVVSVLPGWAAPLLLVATVAINVAMFWFTFVLIGGQKVGWGPLLPGAILAGAGLEAMTLAGAIVLPRTVASSSTLYGSLGVAFALLAWLLMFGRLLVFSSTVNVVAYERKRGTVTLEVEAPRMPGPVPIEATRGGAVVEAATP